MATRQQLREDILENWLAEVGSDFFTPATLNKALDHEYRRFCADSGAGPVAEFAFTDANGTKRSWDLPTELVDIWRVDYDTTRDEVPFLPFQQFTLRFGDGWLANTGTGLPDAYAVLGSHGILFEPIPANLKTWRLYGPIIPDAPAADSTTLLILDTDAYTVAKRAYVWTIERNLSRMGTPPPNYERAIAEAEKETVRARERIRRMYGGIRAAGRIDTASVTSVLQRFGPSFKWP